MTEQPDPDAVYRAPDTIRQMLIATWALLYSMAPDQRSQCEFPMAHPSRLDWDFIPKPDRHGLSMAMMNTRQRTIAHTLLAASLSVQGYSQALQIMAMENMLREIEVGRYGTVVGEFRNSDQYFFAFYGRPGFEDTWGWRVLGHHLSLSYTIIDQEFLTVSPCNMGAQPAVAGLLNPLGIDEDLGFALLDSLDDAQRATAIIHSVAPPDYATRQVPFVGKVEYPDAIDLGIPWYRISEDDREALKFCKDAPAGIGGADLSSAQAGADRRGAPHYFRVQGTHLLIEFDNAIDEGNHIHSVLRDYRNDLGHDLLAEHYERERHTGHHLTNRLQSSVPDV